jgi:hypothetical protein
LRCALLFVMLATASRESSSFVLSGSRRHDQEIPEADSWHAAIAGAGTAPARHIASDIPHRCHDQANVSPVSCREAPGNGRLGSTQRLDTGLLDETETHTGRLKTRAIRGASWGIVSRNAVGSQEQGELPECAVPAGDSRRRAMRIDGNDCHAWRAALAVASVLPRRTTNGIETCGLDRDGLQLGARATTCSTAQPPAIPDRGVVPSSTAIRARHRRTSDTASATPRATRRPAPSAPLLPRSACRAAARVTCC